MKKLFLILLISSNCFMANAARNYASNLQVVSVGTWALDGGLNYFIFKTTAGQTCSLWCPLNQINSHQLLSTVLTAKGSGQLVNIGFLDESPNWSIIGENNVRAGSQGLLVKAEIN